VESLTSDSISTSHPANVSFVNRPASSASWNIEAEVGDPGHELCVGLGLVPSAMIPNPIRVSPFCMKPGISVCSGRLWGASVFGLASREAE